MSLNITDAINATPSQALSRSTANAAQAVKRSTGQAPDGSDSVAKPRSAPDQPDRPAIRAHPTVSTEDSLRRLPEAIEWALFKNRARKVALERSDAGHAKNPGLVQKSSTPYDPPPVRQHDLDLLA